MIFSRQIKNNTLYYCFLKGVLYIIQNIPESYAKYVLIRYENQFDFDYLFFSAKHFIAILPFAYLGFMSLMSLLAQYSVGAWLVYNKVEKKESEIDELKEGDFQF